MVLFYRMVGTNNFLGVVGRGAFMIIQESLSHISVRNNRQRFLCSLFNLISFKKWLLPLNYLLLTSLFCSGGLTVRAILETMDDHNVDSFISLSSPQMGQYGGI